MAQEEESELSEVERIKIDRAFDRLQRLNYYEVLNLPRSATRSQIKRNYYTVSKEFHPDRYFRRNLGEYKDKLEAIFDLITRAYNTLSDEAQRTIYDQGVIEEEQRRTQPSYEIAFSPTTGANTPPARGGEVMPREAAPDRPGPKKPQAVAAAASPPAAPAPPPPPGARPVFMDRLQQQFMGRIVKAREYLKLGRDCVERGQFIQAAAHLQLAVSFDPRNEEARTLLEQATTRVNEVKAESHYQRGLQEEMVGNLENAVHYFKMAVDCKPKRGYYYYKLGMHEMAMPDSKRQGIEHLKSAASVEPNNVDFAMSLARAYDEVGMPRNALREYERAQALDKSNEDAARAIKKLKAAV